MEEEAEKLKEMQKQVEESIMSPTVGQSTCKIQLDFGFPPPSSLLPPPSSLLPPPSPPTPTFLKQV